MHYYTHFWEDEDDPYLIPFAIEGEDAGHARLWIGGGSKLMWDKNHGCPGCKKKAASRWMGPRGLFRKGARLAEGKLVAWCVECRILGIDPDLPHDGKISILDSMHFQCIAISAALDEDGEEIEILAQDEDYLGKNVIIFWHGGDMQDMECYGCPLCRKTNNPEEMRRGLKGPIRSDLKARFAPLGGNPEKRPFEDDFALCEICGIMATSDGSLPFDQIAEGYLKEIAE